MFAYFDGSLEDFLNHITENRDNRLVKIRLAPATTLDKIGIVTSSYHHVLDSFAVNHIIHRHGGRRESLRGQTPVTLYKRKRRLTDAKSPEDSADSGFASFLNGTHRRKELNSAISGFVPTSKVSNNLNIPNNPLKLHNYIQTHHPFHRSYCAARILLNQGGPHSVHRPRHRPPQRILRLSGGLPGHPGIPLRLQWRQSAHTGLL